MRPSEFLDALWGDKPAGRVQLWRLADKRAMYPLSHAAADYYIGADDVYTCVALTFPKRAVTAAGRPRAEHAVAIAGMWLDIDLPAAEALDVAHAIARPTLTVNSGNGVHAWWLLEQPWMFKTKADQADAQAVAWQWQELHRRQTGVQLDATHDLARLMRLPGTINAKGGNRAPVEALATDGPKYVLDDIRATAAAAGPAPLAGPTHSSSGTHVNVPGNLPPGTLDALLDDPDIHATFHHTRIVGDGSMSAYDMSLASQLHHAGTDDDQRIADIVAAHRLHHDPTDRKHQRVGYLRATITRARAGHDSEAPQTILRGLRDDARKAA